MGMKQFGDWLSVKKIFGGMGASKSVRIAKGYALRRTLAYLEGQIKRNIRSSGSLAGKPFALNAPLTIEIKGSSKPLINTGDMMANVRPIVVNDDFGFIGLKRGTAHKDGGDVADIGEVNEYGYISEDGVSIPPRPFIGPVLDEFGEEARNKYAEAFAEKITKMASES